MTRTLKISTILGRGLAVGALSLCAAGLHTSPAFALDDAALPSGGLVTGGSASFDYSSPNELHVHQSSDRAVIDWDSFNIGTNALTQFHQNNSSSIVVNRVTGSGDPTQILGTLRANGIVMVLDRNGVIFGEGARVDVGGIIASTGTINDSAFMAGGTISLSDIDTSGSVINHGMISVADAGLAAFVAPTVINSGIITAKLGRIQIGSGESATLDLYGDGLLEVAVSDESMQQALSNTGILHAEGGTIQITAAAAKNVVNSVINVDGVVSASSATVEGGKIILHGGKITVAKDATLEASSTANGGGSVVVYADDTTHIAGTLLARGSTDENGGFIETSATNRVTIADTAHIDSGNGQWLIDPTNFTIADAGGDITTATLAAQLALNNVTIETADAGSDAGDIFVGNALTWTGSRTLTLKAHRNIEVNAAITNAGGGSLVLRADKTGSGTGTVIFGASGSAALSGGGRTDLYYNPTAYTTPTNYSAKVTGTNTAWMLVNNITQLQAMNTAPTGSYALGRDIDASITSTWNAGAGFVPIGNAGSRFGGKFDGLGHTINNLFINLPTTDYVGLFGFTSGSVIRNVGLVGGSVTGRGNVGGLVGHNYAGSTVSNSYANGTVSGNDVVGGLVGWNQNSTIANSHSTSAVTGPNNIAGLAGYNSHGGSIIDSYATGTVSGTNTVGGLVARNGPGTITNSYATGAVSGINPYVGGLVGYLASGTITNSYATGAVTGNNSNVGGLVGFVSAGNITNSYATGSVSGTTLVGGLIGSNSGTITNSYATGSTTGSGNSIGGLVGLNSSTITGSYATGAVSGFDFVGGIAGRHNSGTITTSYATGNVSGHDRVGGLSGDNVGALSDSYSTGNVSGNMFVGGLIGYLINSSVSRTYSTGNVVGVSNVGGLIGANSSTTVTASYWNTQTSGRATSPGGGTGLTTAQMKQMASFSGWNIASTGSAGTIWRIYEGHTSPLLASFLTPLTVSAVDVTVTYDANAYSGGSATYSGFKPGDTAAVLSGTLAYVGTSQGATNAGTYGITLAGGLYSSQQGYDISYSATPATLTIAKRDITAVVKDDSRAYGAANPAWDWNNVTWNNLAGGQNGSVLDAFLLSSDAGTTSEGGAYAITLTGFTDNNYNLIGSTPGRLTVGARPGLPLDAVRIVNAKLSATSTSVPQSDVHLVASDNAAAPNDLSAGCLAAMNGACVVR